MLFSILWEIFSSLARAPHQIKGGKSTLLGRLRNLIAEYSFISLTHDQWNTSSRGHVTSVPIARISPKNCLEAEDQKMKRFEQPQWDSQRSAAAQCISPHSRIEWEFPVTKMCNCSLRTQGCELVRLEEHDLRTRRWMVRVRNTFTIVLFAEARRGGSGQGSVWAREKNETNDCAKCKKRFSAHEAIKRMCQRVNYNPRSVLTLLPLSSSVWDAIDLSLEATLKEIWNLVTWWRYWWEYVCEKGQHEH